MKKKKILPVVTNEEKVLPGPPYEGGYLSDLLKPLEEDECFAYGEENSND